MTHEQLYDNFNKKKLLNFYVKIVIKYSCVKYHAFSRKMIHLCFLHFEVKVLKSPLLLGSNKFKMVFKIIQTIEISSRKRKIDIKENFPRPNEVTSL